MSPTAGGGSPGGAEPLRRMELAISVVLRAGVLASAAVIFLGILWFALTQDTGYAKVLPHHLQDLLAFHQASGPGYFPTAPRAVLAGAAAGRPYAIIELGILLLVATPVLRVGLSVVFFLEQRDWLYAAITLFVLAVLLLSLVSSVG